jgi:3-hydroxy-9,10-secoandrosta-1,3,5(10)-triene-9,17-dione monooxygenase
MSSESVLDRTKALVPYLREQAQAAEQARRLPDETFDALAEAGVLKMCAPKKYGGEQLPFEEQCDVLAEVARGCPSSSWVSTILSAMGWWLGTFSDDAQDEVLGDGDPRISGVLSPTGTLTPTDGGFRLNGRWPFNTGGHGSRWVILNALLDGMPTALVVPSADLKRLDDWYASGMGATGSSTVLAEDVFVPAHRTQTMIGMTDGQYATDRHTAADPYYNLPLAAVLAINGAGTPVGTARGAMDVFMERLPGRAITYTDYTDQSAAPVTHLNVAEASLIIDSADAHMRLAARILDQPADGTVSFFDRVKGRAHVTYLTGLSRQAVDILFFASGASAIQGQVPIQRFQRDIQALANHAIMHAPTGNEIYGRVLCGLQPHTLII